MLRYKEFININILYSSNVLKILKNIESIQKDLFLIMHFFKNKTIITIINKYIKL